MSAANIEEPDFEACGLEYGEMRCAAVVQGVWGVGGVGGVGCGGEKREVG